MEYDFIGHYTHSLDSKNRVAIPAKYRSQIEDGKVVVTKGFDGCLVVYPLEEWQKLKDERISRLDMMDSRGARDKMRKLLGGATPCDVDKQGRIGLTAYHLKRADITKEVVFTGIGNCFEVWAASVWDEYEEDSKERERAEQ
ncbi:MAG: division/cell wall cluster transcriptional repressor MraZ [Thermoleophilia bacterium]